jgi:polyhydroxybutyrate depolymerase
VIAALDRRDPGVWSGILIGMAARGMRNLLRLGVALALLGAAAAATAQPAPLDLRFAHDGRERRYLLQLPAARPVPAPLVVVLHGGGGGGADAVAFDQPPAVFREIAERDGLLVAYPEGVGAVWNDCRSENTIAVSKADDVGFLVALAGHLVAARGADPGRLFLTGASNGGMMALRVAAEAPGVFAAIAPTIANEPADPLRECARPSGRAARTALLLMNGTLDPWMPWLGGPVVNDPARGFVLSTGDTLARFVDRNGCSGKFAQRVLPNLDPGDGSTLVEQRWLGCAPDAPLVAINVVGGGHCLPSRTRFGCIGRQNRDAEAAELISAFFREVPIRSP